MALPTNPLDPNITTLQGYNSDDLYSLLFALPKSRIIRFFFLISLKTNDQIIKSLWFHRTQFGSFERRVHSCSQKGSVVVICENINVKRLNIQLHRTSYDWTQSCIQIQINHALTYELRVQNIGLKEYKKKN